MLHVELFARFVLISLIAFGGGQAALPLVEQVAVRDTGWLTPSTFGTAVALGYVTPGPVLITATFIGQQTGGLLGAIAATAGAFVAPWALAAATAQQVTRLAQSGRLRAFGAGATPAVIGCLAVTVLDIARESVFVSWPYFALSIAALVLALSTRVHPVILLCCGAACGWLVGRF